MSVKQVESLDLSYFYKENKQEAENVNYPASKSFVDQDGKIINWVIRPITAKEEAMIRERCTETRTDRRTGVINEIFDDQKYTLGLTAQGVVFPDLLNSQLQKSYGVNGATNLLKEMLTAGELQSLALKVIEVSGLDDIEGAAKENELKSELAKNN